MATQAHEEREEEASSSHSVMAEFYVLNRQVYVAVKDAKALSRAITMPDAAMWLPPSENVQADMTTEEQAKQATDYNLFKEKGLGEDGVFILGELERRVMGTENDIELVPE